MVAAYKKKTVRCCCCCCCVVVVVVVVCCCCCCRRCCVCMCVLCVCVCVCVCLCVYVELRLLLALLLTVSLCCVCFQPVLDEHTPCMKALSSAIESLKVCGFSPFLVTAFLLFRSSRIAFPPHPSSGLHILSDLVLLVFFSSLFISCLLFLCSCIIVVIMDGFVASTSLRSWCFVCLTSF